MKLAFSKTKTSGFSLVEVLVVVVVMVIVFGGLFVSFRYTLQLVSLSRANLTALSLATDRMEYLRSLAYDDLGTVLGIPSGSIPQNRTVNLNNIDFNERVLIEFVDDPADGLGSLDDNGVIADYKQIKVEYSWTLNGVSDSLFLVSYIVPKSIETDSGGGSARINVFDNESLPVSGASVRLVNTTLTPNIDVTRSTNASGEAIFTGAPAGSNYQVFVTKTGYSNAKTYEIAGALANPYQPPFSVLEADISTMNFKIDKLSDLVIQFISTRTTQDFLHNFSDLTSLEKVERVTSSSGQLVLETVGSLYEDNGFVVLPPLTPTIIKRWGTAEVVANTPPNTTVKIQFYTATTTTPAELIPNSVLSGNSSGFASRVVNLQGIDPSVYPSLVPVVYLATSDKNFTPEVASLTVDFEEDVIPLSSLTVNLKNNTAIGTAGDSSLVYKYEDSTTTDSLGKIMLAQVEFGVYDFSAIGKVVAEACSAHPYELKPGTTASLVYLLSPQTANNLRVAVVDNTNQPVIKAEVKLSRPGFSTTLKTGWCGQIFFDGLTDSADYTLEISAPGFTTETITNLNITGEQVEKVILSS